MKITPERLRQIIEEEVMARLTEQDEEEEYKKQSRRDLLKTFGRGLAALAGGGLDRLKTKSHNLRGNCFASFKVSNK